MKNFSMKIFICVVLLSLVLMLPTPGISEAGATEKSVDTYYDEGTEFLRKGALDNAIGSFTSTIDLLIQKTVKTTQHQLSI